MLFSEDLATELILSVFYNCRSVSDALALASTCHRFHRIFASRKLEILEHAAEKQYGPLHDAIQLLTHNESQPAHLPRSVPLSLALLQQLVHVGRIAARWTAIYPLKKWKSNYEDRRLLTQPERHRFRRALYRLWLFDRAFHTPAHPREDRLLPRTVADRADLLHNWPTTHLAEIADVQSVLRDVIHTSICPSNGAIARKYRNRFPDADRGNLLFNIHLNYPEAPARLRETSPSEFHRQQNDASLFYTHIEHTPAAIRKFQLSKYNPTTYHEPGAEGWGDEVLHYYVVEDMLKLDPEALLWLKDHAPLKRQVETYVKGLGDWFENNGETFAQTMEWVLEQRGEEVAEMMEGLACGELGVVAEDEE
ncbi:hypothetical protein P152DRAFT_461676 [Eremomyces bilateralis CBS 781.70]|uniref:F-box domain-containing protein n=1 Tax=Eremomyces bilateralis CBS 781.70 TaxID=1392243 RepID=A0A6G1FUB7_9PEZI|nr:uncharacterized protein P152DRAFT_461676 [Eremomyces bilateralis CBS 781.70]KAF1809259.1 hypothetical protein P152DRAFT_461676 [Eremomyces bilateralis CBS 781.70]